MGSSFKHALCSVLCNDKHNIHIHLLIDNTTAVAYVREQGGSRSLECNKMAWKFWVWAHDRKKCGCLAPAHIQDKTNNTAAWFWNQTF